MSTVHIVFNTPAAPTIQKILKLENNLFAISILNLKKWAYAKSDSLSGSHFFSLCSSKEKKLKAIIIEASSAEAGNNTAAGKDAEGNDISDNTGNNTGNKDAAGGNNGDNIAGA